MVPAGYVRRGADWSAVVVVTLIVLALAALSGWLLQGDKAER